MSDLRLASRTKDVSVPRCLSVGEMLYEAFGKNALLWGTGYPGTHRALPSTQELAIIQEHLPFLLEDDQHWILGKHRDDDLEFAARDTVPDPPEGNNTVQTTNNPRTRDEPRPERCQGNEADREEREGRATHD